MAYRIFPWCPGVKWELAGHVIRSRLPSHTIEEALTDREVIICCDDGGVLGAFFSLPFIKFVSSLNIAKKVWWSGPKESAPFAKAQGATPFDEKVEWSRYPTPWVIKKDMLFWNVMSDCFSGRSVSDPFKKMNRRAPIAHQILSNLLVPFSPTFYPRLSSQNRDKPFVVYVKSTNESKICSDPILQWNEKELGILQRLLLAKGIELIKCSSSQELGPLLQGAKVVIAEEIDYSLVTLLFSKGGVVGTKPQGWDYTFDLEFNRTILKKNNPIYLGELSVEKVFGWIEKGDRSWKIK